MVTKESGGKVKKRKRENTKERIVLESLNLFNIRGERNVTTNHIASELGISPGNLYYYFKNKQEIIYELFLRYESELEGILQVPEEGEITFDRKMKYFEGIFESMWEYRFLHRDIVYLLDVDDNLRRHYSDFAGRIMIQACAVYKALISNGIIVATEEEIRVLVLNIWVVCSSWASFLYTTNPELNKERCVSKEMLKRGIYQIVCMEAPYLSEHSREVHLPKLKETYYVGGNWPLPLDNNDAVTGS